MSHGPDFLPPMPPPDPAQRHLDAPAGHEAPAAEEPAPGPRRAVVDTPPAHPHADAAGQPSAAPLPVHWAEPSAKVVERPHPLTGLARGGIALVAGGYFVGREVLEGGQDWSNSALFIGLGLLLVAIVAGISGVFTWRTTTFVADDDEFRIERRFLSQSSSRVDYTKVQSVDVSQPIIARLMGLAKVHVDVGGAGGLDIAFLSRARAESLREHLVERMQRARAPQLPSPAGLEALPYGAPAVADLTQPAEADELVVQVPARNLLAGTFVSLSGIGALLGGIALVTLAVVSRSPVTSLAVLLGIGGWIWNQSGRNWNFQMTRRDGALRLTRGALSTTAQGLRPGRIQAVAIKQDLLQRATGLYQMTVTVLGYGDPTGDESRRTNAVILPFGTWGEVLTVLRAIWPELDLTQVQPHAQPERAKWITPLTFRTHTWGIGDDVVIAQHGLLERVVTIVPHRRMQSASLHQGPLQRRLRLASVLVHTTDGPVSQRLYHLDEHDARRLFEEQVARARLARAGS